MVGNRYSVLLVAVLTIALIGGSFGVAGAVGGYDSQAGDDPTAAPIDSALQEADGTVEVVVRFEEIDQDVLAASDDPIESLREQSNAAQAPLIEYADSTDAVTVEEEFWITNAALVSVDTAQIDLEAIASYEEVSQLHANYEVEAAHTTPAASTDSGWTAGVQANGTSSQYTYGLEQMNVPAAWDEFDTKGEGSTVAVLDTGVDVEHHPELAPIDGGWNDFVNGEPSPYDDEGHGTHVTGTVIGQESDDGITYGVAPEADTLKGKVLDEDGAGTFGDIVSGIEWAVEHDADVDVINLSLGTSGNVAGFIDPIQNAKESGVVVVASSGNSGHETSSSPANVYDALAIGASTEEETISSLSSGETVDTDEAWGHWASDHWPDEYVVPDAAAPGEFVYSAVPGGDYAYFSGTSMAAPHVAGTVALMQSASDEQLEPHEVESTLVDTAWKPDDEPDGQDERFGHGLVDAHAATEEASIGDAEFELVDVSLNESSIEEGESVEVTAIVTNTGESAGTYTAGFEVDGAIERVRSATIEPEFTEQITSVIEFEAAGTYQLRVNDEHPTELTVEEPPSVTVTDASIETDEITVGESVPVIATVKNPSDETLSHTLTVGIDDEEGVSENVSVDPGEHTVTLEQPFEEVGEFAVSVDDVHAGSLTVQEAPTVTVTDANVDPGEVIVGESATVTATVENPGDETLSHTLTVGIDDEEGVSENISLDPGEHTVTLEQPFEDVGEYAVSVDGVDAGSVTVVEPAAEIDSTFEFSPSNPEAGEEVQITATIDSAETDLEGISGGEHDFETIDIETIGAEGDSFDWNLASWQDNQQQATLVWTATIPEDTDADSFDIEVNVMVEDKQMVTIGDSLTLDPPETAVEYYGEDGQVGDTQVFAAVQDWQNSDGFFADKSGQDADVAIFEVVQTWQAQG